MMRKINFFLVLLAFAFFVVGCQSVKDNLSMKKKQSSDEFLIKKKNPLVLPPEFSKLPNPDENNEIKKQEENKKCILHFRVLFSLCLPWCEVFFIISRLLPT